MAFPRGVVHPALNKVRAPALGRQAEPPRNSVESERCSGMNIALCWSPCPAHWLSGLRAGGEHFSDPLTYSFRKSSGDESRFPKVRPLQSGSVSVPAADSCHQPPIALGQANGSIGIRMSAAAVIPLSAHAFISSNSTRVSILVMRFDSSNVIQRFVV